MERFQAGMARRKNARVRWVASKLLNLLAVFPYLAFGQNQEERDTLEVWKTLQEVEVNALSLPSSQYEYGGMVGVINSKKLSVSDPTIATNVLNQIPGVYWHSGALNTNRITIRGIGSRSPFSTNKIRAYYQDIPLTDGGGETTLEDIDLSFVSGIEVQKGANSSLYGSGLGGTVFLKKLSSEMDYVKLNTSLGSYGMLKSGVASSLQIKNVSIQTGYQYQTSDGYRDNNSFERQTFFSNLSFDVGKSKLDFLGLFLKQKAFIPSSLGFTNFTESPTNAAFTWEGAKGFEDYDRWLLGLTLERDLGNQSKLISTIYTIGRDAYEPRPFNILTEKNAGLGLRSRWERIGDSWSLSAGLEAYSDQYQSSTFENLYRDNGDDGSLQGAILTDGEQPRAYLNAFAESKYYLKEKAILSAGLNVNKTKYQLETKLPDQLSQRKEFNLMVSPRLSVTYLLNENANVFATISHGFSPPSVDDSSNPDGSFNLQIQPETGWNREMGFKRGSSKSNVELSFYSMDIRNLLVTRRTAEDIVFGVNAGRTLHNGIEASFENLLISRKQTQVTTSLTYSLSDFVFKNFVDDGADFSGNELTGVPKNQLNISIAQETKWFFSGLSYQYVDAIPITDDNAIFSNKYQLLNFYTGANLSVGEKWSGQLMLRLNNVLDERYASMLSINAGAFGSAEPRYYYPGLPLHYQASLAITYQL